MNNKKCFKLLICIAVFFKLFIFILADIHAPQSKFVVDSNEYLLTGKALVSKGVFANYEANGKMNPETRRTPGYPLFLGILNNWLGIPLVGVVFIQVLLTLIVAFMTFKIALLIEPGWAALSALIVLYAPNISIYSMMILTETLFLFLLTAFVLFFIDYLKTQRLKTLILSSLVLVLAVYVRPGGYFLGLLSALFILYAHLAQNIKKTICHVFIFLAVVYILLGIWQVRNYADSKALTFSSILQTDPGMLGIYKSYARNTDSLTHGMAPLPYYLDVSWRCFVSLMTYPGSFKYFNCHTLTILGKVTGYALSVFGMIGFCYGVLKTGRNIYYQFILLTVVYFIAGSIFAELWYAGDRFRVPVTPLIAIISAYGWFNIVSYFKYLKVKRS